ALVTRGQRGHADALDAGQRWCEGDQVAGEPVEPPARALHLDDHGPRGVAHRATELMFVRQRPHERAKADALHNAVHGVLAPLTRRDHGCQVRPSSLSCYMLRMRRYRFRSLPLSAAAPTTANAASTSTFFM